MLHLFGGTVASEKATAGNPLFQRCRKKKRWRIARTGTGGKRNLSRIFSWISPKMSALRDAMRCTGYCIAKRQSPSSLPTETQSAEQREVAKMWMMTVCFNRRTRAGFEVAALQKCLGIQIFSLSLSLSRDVPLPFLVSIAHHPSSPHRYSERFRVSSDFDDIEIARRA